MKQLCDALATEHRYTLKVAQFSQKDLLSIDSINMLESNVASTFVMYRLWYELAERNCFVSLEDWGRDLVEELREPGKRLIVD